MERLADLEPGTKIGPGEKYGVGLIGVGVRLGSRVVSNEELIKEKKLQTTPDYVFNVTGIRNRHFVGEGERNSDLATGATRDAMKMAKITAENADQIYVATVTPDFRFPGVGNYIQNNISPQRSIPALDGSNACNGLTALGEISCGMIESGRREMVLLVGSEVLSPYLKDGDLSADLFADGAGAGVLGIVKDPGPYGFDMGSDGSKADRIIYKANGSACPPTEENMKAGYFDGIFIDGHAVFPEAVASMIQSTMRAAEKARVKLSDIRWFMPHQANWRIILAASDKLRANGFTGEEICYMVNMGNISAGSPFAAATYAFEEGWLQKGDLIASPSIGSGYNFGCWIYQWNIENPKKDRPEGSFIKHHPELVTKKVRRV